MLDPFMGSGTVLKVAQRLHRNSLGIEIQPLYYQQYINEVTTSRHAIPLNSQETRARETIFARRSY